MIPYTENDIIKSEVPRTLPVELDDVEMLEIARAKAKKEQSVGKLKIELAGFVKQKKSAIDEQEKLIATMTDELASGKQMRQVLTDEVWHKGMVHTIRLDTGEVVEKRPPTMLEQQRKIPQTDTPTPSVDVELHGDNIDAANDDDGDSTASKRAKPSGKKARVLTPEQREAAKKRDRDRRAAKKAK
jgi:hypothetical protein